MPIQAIVTLVISFIVQTWSVREKSIDWSKVRKNVVAKVREFIPGSLFDDAAQVVAERVVGLVEQAVRNLSPDEVATALKLLTQKKFRDASLFLQAAVVSYDAGPRTNQADLQIYAALEQHEPLLPNVEPPTAEEKDLGLEETETA